MSEEVSAKNEMLRARAKYLVLRPWFKKKRFVIPIALVLFFAISSGLNDYKSPDSNSAKSQTSHAGNSVEQSPANALDALAQTLSQSNAIRTANEYLKYSGFSKSGLIEQLVYEGYSEADSEFAVKAISPDWNDQALKTAQEYLKYSGYSRSGLIEQLEYEGYTKSQAEFGVSAAGL